MSIINCNYSGNFIFLQLKAGKCDSVDGSHNAGKWLRKRLLTLAWCIKRRWLTTFHKMSRENNTELFLWTYWRHFVLLLKCLIYMNVDREMQHKLVESNFQLALWWTLCFFACRCIGLRFRFKRNILVKGLFAFICGLVDVHKTRVSLTSK